MFFNLIFERRGVLKVRKVKSMKFNLFEDKNIESFLLLSKIFIKNVK